jgi:hypothetical protein
MNSTNSGGFFSGLAKMVATIILIGGIGGILALFHTTNVGFFGAATSGATLQKPESVL